MISIQIFGEVFSQQRPRFVRAPRNVIVYDPQKGEKDRYRWQIKSQFRNNPLLTPVSLHIKFFLPIPKATSQIRKKEMIADIHHHQKKPDIDNLAKFVLDCMNGIVFKDDSQIYKLFLEKSYAEKEGILILIEPYCHQKESDNAISEGKIKEDRIFQYPKIKGRRISTGPICSNIFEYREEIGSKNPKKEEEVTCST